MATYVPDLFQLEKARAKKSFILVVEGKDWNNDIFVKWETYAQKKALSFTNVQGIGHDAKREMFKDMVYWIAMKAPSIDLVLEYAKKNPDVRMRIYL
jgi:hypothetical protein